MGYGIDKKAFRVYNLRTQKVHESMHVTFDESTSAISSDNPHSTPKTPSEQPPTVKETRSTHSKTIKQTSPFYPSMRFKPSNELKIGSDVRMEVPSRLNELSQLYHSSSAPLSPLALSHNPLSALGFLHIVFSQHRVC